jgi:putative heme d1 biosynthesis radical SAM protein NirJ2
VIVSWNTTQACNINCRHCYRSAGQRAAGELSTDEGKRLLSDLARVGFKIVVLSGGEPLLRADIYELIEYARKLGLRPVIGTNGILITPEVAARLKAAGLACTGISVDSSDENKHNSFRGSDTAWERTMSGIKACREAALPFQIHTTVMKWNLSEVVAISDMAVSWGAVAHHIFFLVPTGRATGMADNSLETTEYEDLLGKIIDKQTEIPIELKPTCAPQFMRIAKQRNVPMRFAKGCLAGSSYCVVLPNGDIQPCPYLPIKAGNVREQGFAAVWQSSKLFEELRHSGLKGSCGRCGYNDICGGCRARAYYYSGDYLAEEPWCAHGRDLNQTP